LDRTLAVACSEEKMKKLEPTQREAIRAGVVQNFEFTYELCWKFMKRWLKESLGNTYVEGVSRRELFRLAGEHGLISNVEVWMDYHDARNETAHAYDQAKAQEIFEVTKHFFVDATKFFNTLKSKNA